MKQPYLLRRALAVILFGALLLGAFCPSLGASASDAITIDDSIFNDYERDHITAYYWYEGFPWPTATIGGKNVSQIGYRFPVILTWDGKYYAKFDKTTNTDIYNIYTWNKDKMHFLDWSKNDDDSGYVNGSFGADGQYPAGAFYQNMGYYGGLLSNITFLNTDLLKQEGTTVSLSYDPALPLMIPLKKATNENSGEPEDYAHYAMLVDSPDSYNYMAKGENFIGGINYMDYRVSEFLGFDDTQKRNFRWTLWPYNSSSVDLLESEGRLHGIMNPNKFKGGDYETVHWDAISANNGASVRLYTVGTTYKQSGSRVSGSFGDHKELQHLLDVDTSIALGHSSNFLGSYGVMWNRKGNVTGNKNNWTKFDFKCYYGEPNIMPILKSDFEVQNGQVSTLDGPIAIPNQTTITVKNGGTLSISGWVANLGVVRVEEGGTLYIQPDSCLNRLYDGKHEGGTIISNGLIIVDENAKLCGGGLEGIKLLDGCHVINYGSIISENMIVSNSYTIENRGSNAHVFAGLGYGVKGAGYNLSKGQVTADGYPEKGQVEEYAYTEFAPNSIYTR